MTMRIPVKNLTTGETIYMWEVDAEEAVRLGPTLYAHKVQNPPPRKNPGGKGF